LRAANAAAQPDPRPSLVLLETQTLGIDPVVGRFVDRALRRGAEGAGYAVMPAEAGRLALEELKVAYPPGMGDLWRATYRLRAERGVFAVVWAVAGRYVVQVRVASLDGSGPFYAQGEADTADLDQEVASLLSQALPQAAAKATAPSAAVAPAPVAAGGAVPALSEPTQPAPAQPAPSPTQAPDADATAREPQASLGATPGGPQEPPRVRLALHDDVAFGIARQSFVNDVLAAGADLRFGPGSWLGGYIGYANLPGRASRVQSVLCYVQVEQRVPLVEGALAIPLRFDLGYLARNGGFLRLSSGLSVALGDRAELVLDLLAPAFWMTPSTTLFSLDLGLELGLLL
jgi:hypothetical protein